MSELSKLVDTLYDEIIVVSIVFAAVVSAVVYLCAFKKVEEPNFNFSSLQASEESKKKLPKIKKVTILCIRFKYDVLR